MRARRTNASMATVRILNFMAEESSGFKQQQQDNEHKAQEKRGFKTQNGCDDRVDLPQNQPPKDRPWNAPQSPEDDNDKRLEQRLFTHHRVQLEDRCHQRS